MKIERFETIVFIKTLCLEDLPKYRPKAKMETYASVSAYLRGLIVRHANTSDTYLELPSVNDLKAFFHCSGIEVYRALWDLRQQEFDFQAANLSDPTMIWDTLVQNHPLREMA